MHKAGEAWVYDQQSFTCLQQWFVISILESYTIIHFHIILCSKVSPWSWWFLYTMVVMWSVDKYIPVVHIILNRLTSISAASFQSNIFLFNIILLLMQWMPLAVGCLNPNQTTLPFSIKVCGDEGIWLDPHNNGRFLQGKRKSLNTTGYYFLWNNAIYPH